MKLFSDLIRTQVRHPIGRQHAFPGKIVGRSIADQLGMPSPAKVTSYFDYKMPTPPALSCVIKPVDGSNSQGVLPLTPVDDEWMHKWTHESRPWDRWIGALHNARAFSHATNGPFFGPWYAERMVNPPVDWKFYCIQGKPIWVRQHKKTGPRSSDCDVRCWQINGDMLFPLDHDVLIQNKQLNLDLPPLRDPLNMLRAVRRLAHEWMRIFGDIFIRVDMFEPMLFGEFTPQPAGGKQIYQPDWDERLGRAWLA